MDVSDAQHTPAGHRSPPPRVSPAEDGPDFIGIGAQRAGTTWLYRQLQRHPDIWLPPVKELHYFDRSPRYPTPSWLDEASPVRRLILQLPRNPNRRRKIARRFAADLTQRQFRRLAWHCRFFFGRYSDTWYRSLFRAGRGKLRGEITPGYSLLDDDDVAHVVALFPAVKIIFVMRHPVERFWSALHFLRRRELPLERLLELPDQARFEAHGDYLRVLSTWRRHVPPERMFTGFFDEIIEDPVAFHARVCAFLGVPVLPLDPEAARRRVNASARGTMPPELRHALARKYHEQVRQLSMMFGGHADRWLAEIEQDLA